jgi:acetolactate synthase regulatory subunit
MNDTEAVESASRYARQKGYDIKQYSARAIKKHGKWEVEFQSTSSRPRPGDFFTVYVDDESGMAERIVYGK